MAGNRRNWTFSDQLTRGETLKYIITTGGINCKQGGWWRRQHILDSFVSSCGKIDE